MNKYDKSLEKGRTDLIHYVSRWKSLNEEIKTSESQSEKIETEISDLQVHITELEQKLDILNSASKEKIKSVLKHILLYGLIELIGLSAFGLTENLDLSIFVTLLVLFFGGYSYNSEIKIKDLRTLKKEYTIESLTEEISNNKLDLSKKKKESDKVSSHLEKLYEEREELKNIIIYLINSLNEVENRRRELIERAIVPNYEGLLDRDFIQTYGDSSPIDVSKRVRVK